MQAPREIARGLFVGLHSGFTSSSELQFIKTRSVPADRPEAKGTRCLSYRRGKSPPAEIEGYSSDPREVNLTSGTSVEIRKLRSTEVQLVERLRKEAAMGISIQGPEPLPAGLHRRPRSPPGTDTPGVVAAASRGIRISSRTHPVTFAVRRGAAVKDVARSDPEVKDAKRKSAGPGYRPVAATAVLAALLLELSTGCGRTVTDAAHGQPDTGLVVVSVLMIVRGCSCWSRSPGSSAGSSAWSPSSPRPLPER